MGVEEIRVQLLGLFVGTLLVACLFLCASKPHNETLQFFLSPWIFGVFTWCVIWSLVSFLFPLISMHTMSQEKSHELMIPCGHFVGFWYFLSMCWCGVGHFCKATRECILVLFYLIFDIRDIRKFTLSLGLLSPPNPSFSGIRKVRKFY